MARGHETFEHTADIGIRAWGKDLPEIFEEAAKALSSVLVDLKTVNAHQKLKLELSAESEEELFFKWLKELLFISETKHIFLSEFKILNFFSLPFPLHQNGGEDKGEGVELIAEASGEAVDSKKHVLGREVKAITRHQFKLVREPTRYLAEVILDI